MGEAAELALEGAGTVESCVVTSMKVDETDSYRVVVASLTTKLVGVAGRVSVPMV